MQFFHTLQTEIDANSPHAPRSSCDPKTPREWLQIEHEDCFIQTCPINLQHAWVIKTVAAEFLGGFFFASREVYDFGPVTGHFAPPYISHTLALTVYCRSWVGQDFSIHPNSGNPNLWGSMFIQAWALHSKPITQQPPHRSN